MPTVRVKICGVTTPADALAAARLGADAVGLNFYPPSPRCLTPAAARSILRELPPFVEPVPLFVESSLPAVRAALADLGPVRLFQWHAAPREPVDAAPYRFIPAFPVRDRADVDALAAYLDAASAAGRSPAAVLVDAHVPGLHGGTGRTAPWDLLADFRSPVPLILAGGLTPDNVAQAVRTVRPYAVDVASGVESRPGLKDPDRMRRFIDEARAAG